MRRAFVLPMVILAMVVVGLTAAIMLQRATSVSMTVTRQVDAYKVQHVVRGLQEAVEAWLSQQRARTIPDALDSDGLALVLRPGDGTTVSLFFFDGQGTARSNGLGVAEDVAPDVDAVADQIRANQGPERGLRFLRDVGPYAVSINAAEPETLVAIAEALAPEDTVANLQDGLARLIEARDNEPVGQEELTQLMSEVRIAGAERTRILRMFTPQPVLWEVIIVVKGDGLTAPLGEVARYRSLVLVEPEEAGQSAFEQPSPFLMWEEMTRGDPRFENPRFWEVGR
ncbi:MAG: hypothetical protein AAGI53_13590 [Planctomycetota bacterium]